MDVYIEIHKEKNYFCKSYYTLKKFWPILQCKLLYKVFLDTVAEGTMNIKKTKVATWPNKCSRATRATAWINVGNALITRRTTPGTTMFASRIS
mgnify:CR=1 FL=1